MDAGVRANYFSSPLHRVSCHVLPAARRGFAAPLRFRRPPLLIRASQDFRRDSGLVDVIGIGSRKDAVIDFCLASSASSSRFRFWTINARDSSRVQLLQRCIGTDMVLRNVESSLALDPRPPAVILVASAGHSVDLRVAMELLNVVKSTGGLAVAILLKPFSFEGQRRLEELDDLVSKLQGCSHFYVVVEADSLLKVEAETLAEALESANDAVFVAINTIFVLMSEKHMKLLNKLDGLIKEVRSFEVLKALEKYGEAKVGFGTGYNIKTAITRALLQCPFHGNDVRDLNGLIIFTLTCSSPMEESELRTHVHSFRQITSCTSEIIVSTIHEPDLEPNLIIVTLLIFGCSEKKVPQMKSFFDGLAVHFPFLVSLFGGGVADTEDDFSVDSFKATADLFNCSADGSLSDDAVEVQKAKSFCKELSLENKRSGVGSSDTSCTLTSANNLLAKEDIEVDMQTEQPGTWNIGPGYQIAQIWANERTTLSRTDKIDRSNIFTPRPVGVKSCEKCSDGSLHADSELPKHLSGTGSESLAPCSIPSTELLTSAGFEAIKDMYGSALTLLKGENVNKPRKKGLLSVRAASMLEAERDSPKSWTPILELQYRGGTYRGRCQGGLPEGKGRLSFADGSFYDGMWRYGKRSGPGTLCYGNGDVFQGSWRDDLMHGKGWFYFHDGERWFANFWKGKANGEGRIYSKDGSIFFGHFHNGWRDGESLCIDAGGSRWVEIWNEGVLISRSQIGKEDKGTGD